MSCVPMVRSKPVPGRKGPGRPKKTWDECVKQDLKVCGLSEAGTQDRVSWRSSVKNSRQDPAPSNGSTPQSMAVPPVRHVLGMRTRSFNKTGFDWLIDLDPDVHCPKNAVKLHSLTSLGTPDRSNALSKTCQAKFSSCVMHTDQWTPPHVQTRCFPIHSQSLILVISSQR